MTDTVWKFRLSKDVNRIHVPEGAQLLTVAEQHGVIALWVRVDASKPATPRDVYLVGTGTPVPPDAGRYIGTAVLSAGSFIFHAFERAPTSTGSQRL